jgi:hypothetical protein
VGGPSGVLAIAAGGLHSLALAATPAVPPAWDVNGDHVVGVLDMTTIGGQWGERGAPGWIPADANLDGVISVLDLVSVGGHWGETW